MRFEGRRFQIKPCPVTIRYVIYSDLINFPRLSFLNLQSDKGSVITSDVCSESELQKKKKSNIVNLEHLIKTKQYLMF